ncbi:DUF177 domain-containing protein [Haliea sp. AH-315-K21]|uniref:Large ribosomal RNA subunit accumulation protein YceD n=1 Tax=SAR86 cluster bacterium TaxID=2030880 RepID=A0A2A5CEF7_9GAMM|nr:DUF177 domain-containing protein [Haliea sp. AH-315-K21]PCJ42113.1 MAG: hypothetical protein COA71_05845 [SAR86 cluster bacterium]
MLLQSFPEIIDVKKFFSRQARLRAPLPLQLLKRLEQYLNKAEGGNSSAIDVDLDFSQDEESRFILVGKMKGRVLLSCQRCLQAVEYSLSSDFKVHVINELKISGDRELAEDELEVVLSLEGKLDLLALVEDELILSLPLVIYHDEADCNQALIDLQASSRREIGSKAFAELAVLKNQLKSSKSKMK